MQDAGRADTYRSTIPFPVGAPPINPAPTPSVTRAMPSPLTALGIVPGIASAPVPRATPKATSRAAAPVPAALPERPSKPPTCLDRGQILDATARVLREKGYDGTTIRTIAKQLDCAVGSIYRYFDDKRSLLDGVCQRRFEAVAEHAELRSSVRVSVQMYARTAAEQPELYRLMFWLASVGKQQMGEALPGVIRRITAGWTESLGDQTQAKRLWAQLHGGVMLGMAPEQAITMLDLPTETRKESAPADSSGNPSEAPVLAQATSPSSGREDLTLL